MALEWEAPSVRKDTASLTTVWADSENPAAGSSGSGSWRSPERKEAPRAGEGYGQAEPLDRACGREEQRPCPH